MSNDKLKKIEKYQWIVLFAGLFLSVITVAIIMNQSGGLYVVDDNFYSRMTIFNATGYSYAMTGAAIVMGITSAIRLLLLVPYFKEAEKEHTSHKDAANDKAIS